MIFKILIFFLISTLLSARAFYFRTVLKEKPRFYTLDWYTFPSPMVELHYYTESSELAGYVSEFAKEFQKELIEKSSITFSGKVPVFLYSARPIFKQTNIVSPVIPEELLGFTLVETAGRVALVHEGSLRHTKHVIQHELVHSFISEIYEIKKKKDRFATRPPLWFEEGVAEALSKNWDSWDDLVMRDLVLKQKTNLEDFNYTKSHSFVRWLIDKYGEDKFFQFLTLEGEFDSSFHKIYSKKLKDVISDWEMELKKKYYILAKNDEPKEFSKFIDEGYSPVLFTSSTIYYIYTEHGINKIVEREIGKKRKKTLFQDMTIKFEFIKGIASDGEKILFIARRGGQDSLFLVQNKKIIEEIRPKDVIDIHSIDILGTHITFSGQTIDGRRDIYYYNLLTKKLVRLTNDFYCDITPNFFSESEILFASDRYGNYDIFLIEHESKNITRITDSRFEEFNPKRLSDWIIFLSDADGTFNLYKKTKNSYEKITNVVNGILDYSIHKHGDLCFVYYDDEKRKIYVTNFEKLKPEISKAGVMKEEKLIEYKKTIAETKPYSFKPVGIFAATLIYNEFSKDFSFTGLCQISDFLGDYNFFLISGITREPIFWAEFENIKYLIGYKLGVYNLAYNLASEKEYYGFKTRGITFTVDYPLSEFHACGLYTSMQVARKTDEKHGLELPFLEGLGPPVGTGELKSIGFFIRFDNSTWNIKGPVSGTIADFMTELSITEQQKLSYAIWLYYARHHPVKESSFAYRFIFGASKGERARVFRLGGFTLSSYDIFYPLEANLIFAMSSEFRFPFLKFIGVDLPIGLKIGFFDIELAFLIDFVYSDMQKFCAIGYSIRIPFGLLLKFNYTKKTDFIDIWHDLSQPGKWYLSLGYNF